MQEQQRYDCAPAFLCTYVAVIRAKSPKQQSVTQHYQGDSTAAKQDVGIFLVRACKAATKQMCDVPNPCLRA